VTEGSLRLETVDGETEYLEAAAAVFGSVYFRGVVWTGVYVGVVAVAEGRYI